MFLKEWCDDEDQLGAMMMSGGARERSIDQRENYISIIIFYEQFYFLGI